ncbi:MAG: D-Ala-D-Ala carboxypeptidase family metallohydrolase [Hyphomonadaceae bacterium]
MAALERFESMLAREGVADVLPVRELWFTDRIEQQCVAEPFVIPPEDMWRHIVPALRYIRDYVAPAIGPVTTASGYRDPEFNACVDGASRSAHRGFYALDLLPRDQRITRERLIEILCPIHAREGRRYNVGLGIYPARRFHFDTRCYRGWGHDHRGASFPCRAPSPDAETGR